MNLKVNTPEENDDDFEDERKSYSQQGAVNNKVLQKAKHRY